VTKIEETASTPLGGGKKLQGGVLQNQTLNPSTGTSRFPQTGARAPIMRRGVEREQTGEPTPEQPEQLEQGTETK
jgi:hypothetical protein